MANTITAPQVSNSLTSMQVACAAQARVAHWHFMACTGFGLDSEIAALCDTFAGQTTVPVTRAAIEAFNAFRMIQAMAAVMAAPAPLASPSRARHLAICEGAVLPPARKLSAREIDLARDISRFGLAAVS